MRRQLICLFVMNVLIIGLFAPPGYSYANNSSLDLETWKEGDYVAPEFFSGAVSLSAGVKLDLDLDKAMFFSNSPEFPTEEGILTRVDNVVSRSGEVRVMYSHFNMLINYSTQPYQNIPANIGVVFINETSRTIDIYHKRLANGVNRTPDGMQLYTDDMAPPQPGQTIENYYGTQLGNAVQANFFTSNPNEEERLWTTIDPGKKAWLYNAVGARGWAIGLGDFVFRDHRTGELITTANLASGERIGIRSFIAPLNKDMETFFRATNAPTAVLNRKPYEHNHMRGFFVGGVYPNSPYGEGITRRKTFQYNSITDGKKIITLNVGQKLQNKDPFSPFYEPSMFVNDILRNGIDTYGRVERGQVFPVPAVNSGSYGADYEFTLQITGPAAIAVQSCAPPQRVGELPDVDLYNQFLTTMLDTDPKNVRTLRIVDPNYMEYYTDFNKLGPLGAGKVAYVLPGEEEKTHVLKLALPANSYGPYKVMLMPLEKQIQ